MRYCHFGVSPVNYSDSDSEKKKKKKERKKISTEDKINFVTASCNEQILGKFSYLCIHLCVCKSHIHIFLLFFFLTCQLFVIVGMTFLLGLFRGYLTFADMCNVMGKTT